MSAAQSTSNQAKQADKSTVILTSDDCQRFGELLMKRCGLRFPESRRAELEHGIQQALAASTCASLDEFYYLIQDPQAGGMELDLLINAVTVSETHFFRDQAQFSAIASHVLPQIIERKRSLRTLRIWSAGCASGEEPYSIAILLRELLPDVDQWSITILATDINTASLERARQAIYGNWAFREERAKEFRPRYFTSAPNNRFALSPEVQRMVQINKLNLVEPCYPAYETNTMMMDLIICRNVTIYFHEAITRWVADRFFDALVNGGWLVVGHSEPSLDVYRRYQIHNFPDTVLYQRMSTTAALWASGTRRVLSSPSPIPPVPYATLTSPTSQVQSILNRAAASINVIPATPEPAKETDPLEHARELLEYGRSTDACNVLLALAKHRPGKAIVYSLLGQAYANLGNLPEAEAWCRRAIERDKLLLDAYYHLSLVLQHQGKLGQAIECMKKVVYINRSYVLGHYGLATLYFESNLMSQAQKSLENALHLLEGKPDNDTIPGSQGITVGRLRTAITSQQQAWSF